ncbi:MAG: response regulator transcription factor [Opitutaceae bacterium]|nr:response regulator transcription factor [Opitutaceae bacterium]
MTEKTVSLGTALLIDDEAYFRRFVGQVLKKALVERVFEACDGREGVKLFQEISPEIVLLDINMPHMGGVETLTALRKLSATVPIIMLTSVSEEKVVEECVGQGATYFIRKDVPAHELTAALQEALGEFLEHRKPSA